MRGNNHSGLGFLTPAQVHHGLADGALAHRQSVLARAYAVRPERFPNGSPTVASPAREVWINRPQPSASNTWRETDHERPAVAGVITKTITRAHLEPLMKTASI